MDASEGMHPFELEGSKRKSTLAYIRHIVKYQVVFLPSCSSPCCHPLNDISLPLLRPPPSPPVLSRRLRTPPPRHPNLAPLPPTITATSTPLPLRLPVLACLLKRRSWTPCISATTPTLSTAAASSRRCRRVPFTAPAKCFTLTALDNTALFACSDAHSLAAVCCRSRRRRLPLRSPCSTGVLPLLPTFVTRAAQVTMSLSRPVSLAPLSPALPRALVISRCRFEQVYSHVQPMASPLAGLQGSQLPAPAARCPLSNTCVRQDQNRGIQPGGGRAAQHQRLHHTAHRPHYRGALHERWPNTNGVILLRDQ